MRHNQFIPIRNRTDLLIFPLNHTSHAVSGSDRRDRSLEICIVCGKAKVKKKNQEEGFKLASPLNWDRLN